MSKNNKLITPRTENQKGYLRALREKDFVILQAPPGTGKTFLTIGHCCQQLKSNKVDKIVFCRATRHHTEALGYTTGSFMEKSRQNFGVQVEYFEEFLGKSEFDKLYNTKVIRLESVEGIRGLNWADSIIVMDEAQECSKDEILRFQTRMAKGSQLIIMGDFDQEGHGSAFNKLVFGPQHPKIAHCMFTEEDNQRHPDLQEVYKYMKMVM